MFMKSYFFLIDKDYSRQECIRNTKTSWTKFEQEKRTGAGTNKTPTTPTQSQPKTDVI